MVGEDASAQSTRENTTLTATGWWHARGRGRRLATNEQAAGAYERASHEGRARHTHDPSTASCNATPANRGRGAASPLLPDKQRLGSQDPYYTFLGLAKSIGPTGRPPRISPRNNNSQLEAVQLKIRGIEHRADSPRLPPRLAAEGRWIAVSGPVRLCLLPARAPPGRRAAVISAAPDLRLSSRTDIGMSTAGAHWSGCEEEITFAAILDTYHRRVSIVECVSRMACFAAPTGLPSYLAGCGGVAVVRQTTARRASSDGDGVGPSACRVGAEQEEARCELRLKGASGVWAAAPR
uniref:Uncharacterized protein n=1 Tax=Oryza punctata TaxID=4537 RepID=A0A0E0K2P6_ORYPU